MCVGLFAIDPASSKTAPTELEQFISAVEKANVRSIKKVAENRLYHNPTWPYGSGLMAISPAEVAAWLTRNAQFCLWGL
jgi:hypothetical protein